jgi:hypothetical protein
MSVVNDCTLSDRAKGVDSAFLPTAAAGAGAGASSSSLCRSVTSHGNALWSLRRDDDKAWTKTFEEPISHVSESADGGLVAVVTIGRIVSLLRGSDGRELITRTLPPAFASSTSTSLSAADGFCVPPILVTWIERSAHDQSPSASTTSDCGAAHSLLLATNVAVEDDHDAHDCHLMLVRNVNALDETTSSSSSSPSLSSERASPKLSTVTVRGYRFSTVVGRNHGDGIRLLGCSIDDASFVALHWDFASNVMKVRPHPVLASADRPHVDTGSGILLQTIQSQEYVMCSTYLETKFRSVEWLVEASAVSASPSSSSEALSPPSLQSSCRYDLPAPHSRVTAMETLHIDSSSLAVAVAVVVSSSSSTAAAKSDTRILVLQLLVEDTMGLVVLSKPHVLYSIPLASDTARVELVATPSYPFWFLFKEWSRTGSNRQWAATYKRFNPPPTASQALARLKGLVEKGQLDEASRILHGDGGDVNRALLADDEYSTFVPSEIPLKQLKAVLVQAEQSKRLDGTDLRSIQQYAKELEEASSTGTDRDGSGISHLLDAADLLTGLMGSPTVAQAQTLLSMAQQLLGNVDAVDFSGYQRDAGGFVERRSARQRDIQDQLDVVGYLSRLIEKGGAGSDHVRLDDHFRSIRTMPQLFEALVEQRFFALAELMWHQSADGQAWLAPHVLVSAILKVPPDASPQSYSALLEDVVLPQLSINHPYLRTVRSWVCRVADRLDETSTSDAGLDSAIHLLEVRSCRSQHCPPFAAGSGRSHNSLGYGARNAGPAASTVLVVRFRQSVCRDARNEDNIQPFVREAQDSGCDPLQLLFALGPLAE